MKDIYTVSVPVLTMSHLGEDDAKRLLHSDDQPVADYGRGMFLYVGEFRSEYFEGYSEAFCNLMRYLSAHNVGWVRFDQSAGDELDGFPTFEW